MDDQKTSVARLKLARGFFETVSLSEGSSEHQIRNALSRCYYSFFHGCHVVLGRYWEHRQVAEKIGKKDARLGQFVERLRGLRREADYVPDVVQREYNGDLDAYRLIASQVLDDAKTQFQRVRKLADGRLKHESTNDRK